MKQNITEYSDEELSMLIFNDETLYRMRRSILKNPSILDDFFEYNHDQLMNLIDDIKDDLEGA
jgi:hypothetical protein